MLTLSAIVVGFSHRWFWRSRWEPHGGRRRQLAAAGLLHTPVDTTHQSGTHDRRLATTGGTYHREERFGAQAVDQSVREALAPEESVSISFVEVLQTLERMAPSLPWDVPPVDPA
jgi:hypothetical protein